MFHITFNPDKNRLYVTLNGHLEPDEQTEAGKAFLAAIKELQPGFDIVSDMSGLHPTDSEGLNQLRRIQAAAKVKGVRSVFRIVRIPLSRLQVERTAEEVGLEFETAASLEEADQRLDAMGAVTPPRTLTPLAENP